MIEIVENDEGEMTEYLRNINFGHSGYSLLAGIPILFAMEEMIDYPGLEEEQDVEIWNQNHDILEIKLDLNKCTLSIKVSNAESVELFTDIKE